MMRNFCSWAVWLISSAIALFSLPAMADFSFGRSEGALMGLGRAYGYLLGQDYTLKRIAKLYPSLQVPVKSAELEFSAMYGSSIKDRLIEAMTEGIGSEKVRQITIQMDSSIAKQVNSTTITQQDAVNFITEVNSRAKGQVDGHVLPYFVAAKYKGQPASEFSAKMRQRFNTQGHPKSLGLNLVLDLPVSWVAAEGERPHIVQKWKSMAGYGQQLITLDIRETGEKVSTQALQELVASGEIKTLAPPGATFINGGTQTVESLPGYWLDYSTAVERAGMQIYLVGRINAFFTSDKAFIISCMTTIDQGRKAEADKDFAKIKALCPMIVNSVVLKDLY